MAGTDVAPIWREILCLDRGECLIRETDVMECAVDFEGREIVGKVKFVRCVRAVEDKVEGEGDLFGPIGVFGRDEVLGAELQCVIFLLR